MRLPGPAPRALGSSHPFIPALPLDRPAAGVRDPREVLVSVAAIVETLAEEFSIKLNEAQRAFDLISGGYKVPVLARFKREEIGSLTDGVLRRFARRMKQLEELDKRRGTLLASIAEQRKTEGAPGADADLAPLEPAATRARPRSRTA